VQVSSTDRHSLQQKTDLLRSQGRFFKYDAELFDVPSWLAVAEGQGWGPEGYNRIADGLSEPNLAQSLSNMRDAYSKAVAAMPTHQAYIDRFCKAEPMQIKADAA